jgi:hypothetical protein
MCQDIPLQEPQTIYPNWDFWFENKPSGNPGSEAESNVDKLEKRAANRLLCDQNCLGKNDKNGPNIAQN